MRTFLAPPPFSLLVVLLWFCSCTSAQERIDPPARYQAVVKALEPFIAEEVQAKKLPALSIALVEDQTVVWAKGFGFADPKAKKPATAQTVYRVGSVSKLFTDIAIMQLVEKGQIDLDAPLARYLPDFKPENPFKKPITLREMMAHRSGLVREPPVGNYFDPTVPTLAQTVASLNRTRLVYEPEARIKYSNAAIGTVGYVLEATQKTPFPRYLRQKVLQPLGMTQSDFEPTDAVKKELAQAIMWTYQGRTFPAPTFELGMAPAGSMYSTVNDLGKFLTVLFAEGKTPTGRILKKETLHRMWQPQFAKEGEKTGFGIGFYITERNGKRRLGHGGAIYGFATELAFLPEEKLGVVVIASCDVANAVTTHLANVALDHMLALKENKPLPPLERTHPLEPEKARALAGHWVSGKKSFDMLSREGKLWLIPGRGGMRAEVRALGKELIIDDRLDHGQKIIPDGSGLRIGEDLYTQTATSKPAPPPQHWLGLIGEYGWDHNTLYILERHGKLYALIEWIFLYPLEEKSADVYAFPDFGLYHGEQLIFTRDAKGNATRVEAASVVFERRKLRGEDGSTFRIEPRGALAQIRAAALKATPPPARGEFNQPDLVDLTKLDDTLKLEIRYATTNNFLGTPFYTSARAFLQRPAAEALVRVHRGLKKQGYGLLIHDAYRPWHVTKMFWDATPDRYRLFVADPDQGSRHNRGCAVDLTLYDLKTGKPIQMVGGYDEFSDRSYPDYLGGTSLQRWHRDLLRHAMEEEGFTVYEAEWWHFDYKDWKKYPIGNQTFEAIAKGRR